MKKKLAVTILTAAMTMAMGLTAFANVTVPTGNWYQDPESGGWRFYTEETYIDEYGEEQQSYLKDGYEWLDGNKDGIAELYVFDPSGWLYTDYTIEGHAINSEGQMLTSDGKVATDQSQYVLTGPNGSYSGDINDQYQWIDTNYWSNPDGEGDHLVLGIGVDGAFAVTYTKVNASPKMFTMNKIGDGQYKSTSPSYTMTLNSDGTITFSNKTFYPY